ncbi:MAG: flavodoxin domain-containing protein [Bacteroidales bacterium]
MNTIIVYASTHGSSEKVGLALQEKLAGEVNVLNLKKAKNVDISDYERVIVGGSIHVGAIQKKVKAFYETHQEELLEKQLGLYLCCMDEERAAEQFEKNYPEVLRKHSSSNKLMGGEYIFERMNFLEKFMVKKISGIGSSKNALKGDAVKEMVEELEKGL